MKEHPEQRVGTCSFLPLDEGKTYDLAYCVHPYFWKQGYATEMAQGMIEYARRQGAEKVTIWVSAENAASCRVAEKCAALQQLKNVPQAQYRSGNERDSV